MLFFSFKFRVEVITPLLSPVMNKPCLSSDNGKVWEWGKGAGVSEISLKEPVEQICGGGNSTIVLNTKGSIIEWTETSLLF